MSDNSERSRWVVAMVVLAFVALVIGTQVGACKAKRRAVKSGCAEWVADPTSGNAVIDWCVCQKP